MRSVGLQPTARIRGDSRMLAPCRYTSIREVIVTGPEVRCRPKGYTVLARACFRCTTSGSSVLLSPFEGGRQSDVGAMQGDRAAGGRAPSAATSQEDGGSARSTLVFTLLARRLACPPSREGGRMPHRRLRRFHPGRASLLSSCPPLNLDPRFGLDRSVIGPVTTTVSWLPYLHSFGT